MGQAPRWRGLPPSRVVHQEPAFDSPLMLYLPLVAEIFAIYFPGSSRLYISRFLGVFFDLFLSRSKLSSKMSSCDSSEEDYMGRRLRRVQQDVNQEKIVGWSTKEEIAAR